ncbi:putative secreted protein [Leifsonia rubra CMS 76R]|nr:putative secreted protein [Leifsonia rubra CMS 76R]
MTGSDPAHDEASAVPQEPTGSEFDDDSELTGAAEPTSSTRRPVSARAAALVGARVIVGVVGIGTATAAILGATFLDLPSVTAQAPNAVIVPVPTAQQLTCPGPLLRLSDDSGAEASSVFTLGEATTRFSSSSGAVEQSRVTASDAETGAANAAPLVLSAAPDTQSPQGEVRLSGAQGQSVSVGDYVGFASAGCRAVGGDNWLVGGATTTGRTTLILLTNPTEVTSTVTLEIFDGQGVISAAGTSGIVVPPNGQRVLSLAGFAPGVLSPVVHVTSTGGQITAELQQSIVRGLDPGGVEIVGPTQPPSRAVVIPGIVVSNLEAMQALRGTVTQTDDLIAAVRVFVPGDKAAKISATLIPADVARAPITFQLDLSAGVVTDIPIEELATGAYTLQIESDQPIVASARTTSAVLTSGSVTATDFAWFTASPALDDDTQFTVAAGLNATLSVVNLGELPAAVTLTSADGVVQEFTIAPQTTLRAAVSNGTTYTLVADTPIHVGITQEQDGFIAAYTVDPQTPGSSPLTVFP